MMNSIRVIVTVGAMLVLLSIVSCASAQKSGDADEAVKAPLRFDQNCNADIEKFCADVEPGDGRIASCLYAHTDLLEDSCYGATSQIGTILEGVFDGIEAFYAACQEDLGQYCAGVMAGSGGQIACLQENLANISAGCSAAMPGVTGSGR